MIRFQTESRKKCKKKFKRLVNKNIVFGQRNDVELLEFLKIVGGGRGGHALLPLVFHPRRKALWKQKYFRRTLRFWEDSLCAKHNTSIVLMANYMLFTQVR